LIYDLGSLWFILIVARVGLCFTALALIGNAGIMTLKDVIFLDRDGVINRDSPDYIKSWEEFEFLPGSLEAMAALTGAGYRLIVITNQSIIGRGMVPLPVLEDMFRRMRKAVEKAGGKIFDTFYCPHRPDEQCDCRKPEPGLIFQAKTVHGIDLPGTVMIGDNIKDVLCGQNAGCGATILVRTGCGGQAEKELATQQVSPTLVVDDLAAAADKILSGPPLPPVCC
jgi:D-glycero-D-manno-heptose 1,7-bisphosphate phosphatase